MSRSINRSSRWTVRLLLAGVPALLVAGVVSAAVLSDDAPRARDTVVAEAGGQSTAAGPLSEGPPLPFAIPPEATGTPVPPAPPGSVPALPPQLPPLPPGLPSFPAGLPSLPAGLPSLPQPAAVSPTTTVAPPAAP
jgi:hypothetical protein